MTERKPETSKSPAGRSRETTSRPDARTIAVTSGKGGVGKTTVVANLAVALRAVGESVIVVDGAFGMGDVDSFFGLDAERTLEDVVRGEATVDDVLVDDAHGVRILPAATGVLGLTSLSHEQQERLWKALDDLPHCDQMLVDTATGISESVLGWLERADEIVLVTTPDPVAWVDAYALLKLITAIDPMGRKRLRMLINQVSGAREATGVHARLRDASSRFLRTDLELLGHVITDPLLLEAARCRQPLISLEKEAPASRCFREIALRLSVARNAPKHRRAALSMA